MINFTPVGKRFLVKQIKAPEKSVGGLIITTKQNQDVYEAIVTNIGTGFKEDLSPLSIGDRVLLTKWVKHDELKTPTDSYMVIDSDSVIARLVD
ncbi:MAG: co-chaperone GroES family protein [Gammaproteobacteria bacterium]|nr:co-chaperone GroES family protein [Gammaproteobacteria bacterium]